MDEKIVKTQWDWFEMFVLDTDQLRASVVEVKIYIYFTQKLKTLAIVNTQEEEE